MLLVDAFSGDAVPVHLLTKEAVALYLKHLRPSGILAFHVSNSYLNLAPVVRQLADFYGKQSRLVSNKGNAGEDETAADWVLVADPATFARLQGGSRPSWYAPNRTCPQPSRACKAAELLDLVDPRVKHPQPSRACKAAAK